jgi:hypothetical protein
LRQPLELAPGWYRLRGWIKAEEAGTNAKHAGGRISIRSDTGGATSRIISGSKDWTLVERDFPILPGGESANVRLEAYRKPDGKVFFDDIELRRLTPPVVEGFLRYPNYRGMLFEDRPQLIQMSVVADPKVAKIPLSDVIVRMTIANEGNNNAVIRSTEQTPSASSFVMTLDAAPLPLGIYTLRLQALKRGDATPLSTFPPYRIVKLPASARSDLSVYVDHDNVLVLGGRRVFALGIYDTSGYSKSPKAYEKRISMIAEAPINLYLNYWFGNAPIQALNALMVTLQKHRMWYLHTTMTWHSDRKRWPGARPCEGQTADELGQEKFTVCMAEELGRNPQLAGWYTVDEEPASEANRVFKQYLALRQGHPGGITFIAQNKKRELSWWRDTADVIDAHKYPIFNIPEGSLSPLEQVTELTEAAQAAVERSRPVWSVVQFYQHGSKGHWPTYEELRTMSYMAIVAGAKGLFYWSYGAKGLAWVKDPQRKEELGQRLVKVTKEIKSLEPALLNPDAPEILTGYTPTETMRVLSKRVGDTRYVIAVNNMSQETRAAFTLSEPAGTVEVIGEGRTVQPSAQNRFDDRFAPYATHVYKIQGPTSR